MKHKGIGTDVICQVGLIVHDIERTARAYADVFGVAMPKIIETEDEKVTNAQFRGQPTSGRARLAFFQMGAVSLELIEPIGGPSTWQEFLDEHGEGVHHIAFQVEGMDKVLARLDAAGIPLIQRGDYTGGQYAYVESEPKLKVILELLESLPS